MLVHLYENYCAIHERYLTYFSARLFVNPHYENFVRYLFKKTLFTRRFVSFESLNYHYHIIIYI